MRSSRVGPWVMAMLVAVLVAAPGRRAAGESCREEELDAQGKCPKKAVAPTPPRPAQPSCPAGMVRVPAGTFRMGSTATAGRPDERPQHAVKLAGYCIDKTEVTVKAYLACVAENACTDTHGPDMLCNHNTSPRSAAADRPANCADWEQAAAYCKWATKRLPTEAEWEYAARGADGRAYPWGNQAPSGKRLNACGFECETLGKQLGINHMIAMHNTDDGWPGPAPVGSFAEDKSPFGVLDMAGNVSEWTADWYGPYAAAAATSPQGPATGQERVLRGGNWHDGNADFVRTTVRRSNDPTIDAAEHGFRCARGD